MVQSVRLHSLQLTLWEIHIDAYTLQVIKRQLCSSVVSHSRSPLRLV